MYMHFNVAATFLSTAVNIGWLIGRYLVSKRVIDAVLFKLYISLILCYQPCDVQFIRFMYELRIVYSLRILKTSIN